jgi:GntR family transcriptional regulator/MocR family aminotransferase
MRLLYKRRRRALLAALDEAGAGPWIAPRTAGGLHVVARLPGGADDRAIVQRAAALGLEPGALSEHAVDARRPTEPGLLLGFPTLPPGSAADAVRRLLDAVNADRELRGSWPRAPAAPSTSGVRS